MASQPKTRGRKKPDRSGPMSLNALAELTGADRATVKRALAEVEPAQWEGDNPQYTLSQLQDAIGARRSSAPPELKERKLEEEVRRLQIQNDRAAGVLVPRSSVAESMARCCAAWNKARLKYEQEAPAQLRTDAKRLTTSIGEELQRLAKEWA